jgi:hypothetical protein
MIGRPFGYVVFPLAVACNVPAPPAPYDVTIVAVSDGGMPCALADAISQARLIRDPDGGKAVVVPCP